MKVNNAVLMAAGTSSRFAPLSYETHKGMTIVHGEVLVERQIRQLKDVGVPEIYIVTGYKADQFGYLAKKYGVKLLHNPSYLERNNNGSIWTAREVLNNSYLCSADNYFAQNPFEAEVDSAYYAAVWSDGPTDEWCMQEDAEGYISSVSVGGRDAWYMLGHAFWDERFSKTFLNILLEEYDYPQTRDKLWEQLFIEHLDVLKMKVRKYDPGVIYEFDTLDELREFDHSYKKDTRSKLVKRVAGILGVGESDIVGVRPIKGSSNIAVGFEFACLGNSYTYDYLSKQLRVLP